MAEKPHSTASLGGRHPVQNFTPLSIAAMMALPTSAPQVGTIAIVGSPLSKWMLAAPGTPGRWVLEYFIEWPSAGVEIDTGRDRTPGSRIYVQRFDGTNSVDTLIGGGVVDKLLLVDGYIGGDTSRFFPAQYGMLGGAIERYWQEVDGSNNLVSGLTGSFFGGDPHSYLAWYTKL